MHPLKSSGNFQAADTKFSQISYQEVEVLGAQSLLQSNQSESQRGHVGQQKGLPEQRRQS